MKRPTQAQVRKEHSRRIKIALEELALWEHWICALFPSAGVLQTLEARDHPPSVTFLTLSNTGLDLPPTEGPLAPNVLGPFGPYTLGLFAALRLATKGDPDIVVNQRTVIFGATQAEQTLSSGWPEEKPQAEEKPRAAPTPKTKERLQLSLARLSWAFEPYRFRPLSKEGRREALTREEEGLPSLPFAVFDHGMIGSEPPDKPGVPQDHLFVPSPGPYYGLQQALSLQLFGQQAGFRFPRADLTRGGVNASAELRPHNPAEDAFLTPEELEVIEQVMWRHCEELSDSDADTLDGIMSEWLTAARSPTDRIRISVDDLLRLRGLKAKRGGTGRRGGYDPKQRAALWRCLLHLQDIWIDIAEATPRGRKKPRVLQSKVFSMTDRVGQRRLDGSMDVEAILVTPGSAFGAFLFGPGRQAAQLSAQAIRYHPTRQHIEKRLARLLAWHWRSGAKSGDFIRTYRVQTLAEEVGLEIDQPKNPARVRDRFEAALDRLATDKVIAGWQYRDLKEDNLPRKGWLKIWLDERVLIEAPDSIKNAYRSLDQGPAKRLPKTAALGERLRRQRRKLGLSQMQAAEEIGISTGSLSRAERGNRPTRRIRAKLEHWLTA